MRITKKIQIDEVTLEASYETESYEMRIGILDSVANDYETQINKNPFRVINALKSAFAAEKIERIAFQAVGKTKSSMEKREKLYLRTLNKLGFRLIEEYKAGIFSSSKQGIFSGIWYGPFKVYERSNEA